MRHPPDAQVVAAVKIREIKPKMRNIEVIGRMTKKESVDHPSKRLAKATLEDSTGSIILYLLETQLDQVHAGDSERVREAYVRVYREKIELNRWHNIETQKR